MPLEMPSREYIRSVLNYDAETGLFHWRRNGKLAGYIASKAGRIQIMIGYRAYYAHRLAWLLAHGAPVPTEIDHIDRNPSNNSIHNLRAATHTQNLANSKTQYRSKTGVKGVFFRRGKFHARIGRHGEHYNLGSFPTIEEAAAARRKAAEGFYGTFARH